MHMPNGTRILVADGRKALILENAGDATIPNLKVIETIEAPRTPSTAELGTDKPGRSIDRSSGRRSAVEQTDWHARAEDEHVRHVAAAIHKQAQAHAMKRLVVVAPPKALAVLRDAFSPQAAQLISDEIAKDLTKHPVSEIERLLKEHQTAHS